MLQNEALRALGEIAEAKHKYAEAIELYKESLSIVQELHDITNISVLYFNVGRALQLAGDNEKALIYFRDGLLQSQRLGKKAGVLRALAGLGVMAAANGEAERAVSLLMTGQLLFGKLGLGFPPNQSAWFASYLESARAQLSEEQFTRVVAEAQTTTLNQAMNYALGDSD